MPLTDIACRNATCPEGKAFRRYADSGGLYLEVTKSGSKLWRLKYRLDGKEKRLALGAYPEVPLQTKATKGQGADSAGQIKGARELRDEARALRRAGTDPSAARRDQRCARLSASETSFEEVARKWWDGGRSNKTARYATYVHDRLEADAFPEIGSKAVAALAAPHFVRVGRRIEEREASELARRVMATCGQVMRWTVAHGDCDRNPVADVKPADVLTPRTVTNFARLETADLPEPMRKITAYDGSVFTRLGMQLMACTLVRSSELIGASCMGRGMPSGRLASSPPAAACRTSPRPSSPCWCPVVPASPALGRRAAFPARRRCSSASCSRRCRRRPGSSPPRSPAAASASWYAMYEPYILLPARLFLVIGVVQLLLAAGAIQAHAALVRTSRATAAPARRRAEHGLRQSSTALLTTICRAKELSLFGSN